MNWLLDLGNTRLKWIAADASANSDAQSLAHVEACNFANELDTAFASIAAGATACLASVAQEEITAAVIAALQRRGAQVVRVHTVADLSGMRIAYATPHELGVDRFLSLLAAHALESRHSWLIVSVGTALTLDLLTADGQHRGGLIAPSPELMRQSLSQRAPHLPASGGVLRDFADTTRDALASGSILAARALIEHSLVSAQRLLAVEPTLLLTGGGAAALGDDWPVAVRHEPNLVLRGLQTWIHAQTPSQLHSR